MKVLCPICNQIGILEERGNSQRISHYKAFIDGKRVYEKHTIMGINGNKSMGIILGIKNINNGVVSQSEAESKRGCGLAWSRLVDLGSIDSGSNPGSPINGSEPVQVWNLF